MRATSRDYRRPARPRLARWFDRLAPVAPLEAQALVAAARARTGLHDLGWEEGDEEAFRSFVGALEEEARLTPLGRAMSRARLGGMLASRLRIHASFERDPSLADEPIRAPLFVTGLQRTGTTKLQRLLAADPQARSLASWEALDPIAPQERPGRPPALAERLAARLDARRGGDGRLLTAEAAERILRYLSPDFFAVHPVEATAPEEEILLMDLAFRTTVAEASYHVPRHARWLETVDQRSGYRVLRRALQVLQRQRGGGGWVLKTPHHIEHLDAVLDVFPDARVVITQREPEVAVASFCSMVAHGRGVFSDDVDPHEVGAHWLRKMARMARRGADFARAHPDAAILQVAYRDLVAQPLEVVAAAYAHAGRTLTDEARRSMQRWLDDNAQHKHGQHRYALADFGLSSDDVAEAFGGVT